MHVCVHTYTQYYIMQIIHGGKLLWLQCLVDICMKTFAVVLFIQYLID